MFVTCNSIEFDFVTVCVVVCVGVCVVLMFVGVCVLVAVFVGVAPCVLMFEFLIVYGVSVRVCGVS